MTYALVTTIEELRAELGHCDPAERAQIQISVPPLRAAPEIRLPHAPPLAVAFRDR